MLGDDVEVDSCGLDPRMAEEFLNGANVGSPFDQGCSEEMA